ncbi:MAG: glycosyltransferase family 4 protein, partial [Nitrospirota bacterium]|nr:glycosyltransferase family 4 protein [Nitrospirota bacterium]
SRTDIARMRLLLLVNEYPPDRTAGTAVATYQLARFMVEKGAEISVVVTERAPGSPPMSDDAGVKVCRLYAGWVPIVRWMNRMRRIRRLVGTVKPDLLHAQSISCGLYAAVAAFGRRLPVLTSIQGQDLYQASFLQRKTEVRWALRAAGRVTAVTPALATLAESLTGVRPIHVVPHGFLHEQGIASRDALRERFGLRPLELVLLCAARLDPIKGVDVLVQAVADVPEATVWLAGDGPERRHLEQMAASLGVAQRLRFLGNLPHRDLAERMRAADLFVLPSRSEAFGIVLAEAMDAGLPIVASRVGGIPGLVEADNGLLVPPEDPAALAWAIRELLADPERRAAMARVNPEKAKAYRWETVGETYWKAYRELLAESRVQA